MKPYRSSTLSPFVWYLDKEFELAKAAFEQGSPLAALDALVLCTDRELDIPKWVAEGYKDALAILFGMNASKKTGQAANLTAATRINLHKLNRWEAVKRARAANKKGDEAFHYAVTLLEGTLSEASYSTVKRDHSKVNKAINSGNAGPFRVPRSRFVQKLIWGRVYEKLAWPQPMPGAPSEEDGAVTHDKSAET